MTTKPIASEGLIERLRDPEYMEGHGVSAKVADEAADALESTNRQLLLYRETIVELWHDSNSGHGTLHECLGMTWEEYQRWANPEALEGSCPDVVGGEK